MYIMDVGKDLNKETGIFVVNYEGYCVNVYSFEPYTVCASFSFCVIVLNHIEICAFARTIFCGVPYQRSPTPLVTVIVIVIVIYLLSINPI